MDLQVKGGRTMLQLSQQKGYAGIATLKLNTKREREEEENFEEEQLFRYTVEAERILSQLHI